MVDNVKFKVTIPSEFKCECGSCTFDVKEVAEESGYVDNHEIEHHILNHMFCDKCHKKASAELRYYLFGEDK